jgi:hypothetical protein
MRVREAIGAGSAMAPRRGTGMMTRRGVWSRPIPHPGEAAHEQDGWIDGEAECEEAIP